MTICQIDEVFMGLRNAMILARLIGVFVLLLDHWTIQASSV